MMCSYGHYVAILPHIADTAFSRKEKLKKSEIRNFLWMFRISFNHHPFNHPFLCSVVKVLVMQPIAGYKSLMQIIRPGAGAPVTKGSKVTVHATGSVKETGYKFWSTKDAGQSPFQFSAGLGQVITGWDQGVLGMKVGETRMLEIPAHEGYGPGGFPAWKIPPMATLIFEIEVLSVN